MRRPHLERILQQMLEAHPNGSDLNFTVGRPPQVEIHGELRGVSLSHPLDPLTPFQTEQMALTLIGTDRRLLKDLTVHGSCDTSFYLPNMARFRVNIFSQKGAYSIVMRRLATETPTIQGMDLPEVFHEMSKEINGLILVTGATGSGKTTSLAAILDEMNEKRPIHIKAGRPTLLRLTSVDVHHSFSIPELRILPKDVTPGHWTEIRLDALERGTYTITCYTVCGMKHSSMDAELHAD